MIFTRNRDRDWLELYKRRRAALLDCAMYPKCPARLLENSARLLLEAHHCGPWRMLWVLFKSEIESVFYWYVWRELHSIKRMLGFKPKQKQVVVPSRDVEEAKAIQELVRQL